MITSKEIKNQKACFWDYAHKVELGNRTVTAWQNKAAAGFVLHLSVEGKFATVLASAFDIFLCSESKEVVIPARSFLSLRTEEGLYRLCNLLSAEGML